MQVSENERKIDNLRRDHEIEGQRLHELQMDDEEDEGNMKKNKRDGKASGMNDAEIDALEAEITRRSKDKETADELNKKVNLVNDQVHDWCSKVI